MIQCVTENFPFTFEVMTKVSITPRFIGVYWRASAADRRY
jgi:hypothetical protein